MVTTTIIEGAIGGTIFLAILGYFGYALWNLYGKGGRLDKAIRSIGKC